eukprot:TRINITY_DN976_c0_g1_i1.p1 TRINITY_DN976_c0_g1~~TRINITY_DN976_c0_g1_i1.p1  ORF type:complete len:1142 (+),score=102.52 TRINITY_DN976_c0_g1_i1:9391-12816(+)
MLFCFIRKTLPNPPFPRSEAVKFASHFSQFFKSSDSSPGRKASVAFSSDNKVPLVKHVVENERFFKSSLETSGKYLKFIILTEVLISNNLAMWSAVKCLFDRWCNIVIFYLIKQLSFNMNLLSCDTLTEAIQRHCSFERHKKRLSEISLKTPDSHRVHNPEYESLKQEMLKNRLKRRYHDAQGKLIEIGRVNKALVERISTHFTKKHNPEFTNETYESLSKLRASPSLKSPIVKREEKIMEENSKMLERLLFPGRRSPVHPSVMKQVKDYERFAECRDRMQKAKQSWRHNFSKMWGSRVASLPPIKSRKGQQVSPVRKKVGSAKQSKESESTAKIEAQQTLGTTEDNKNKDEIKDELVDVIAEYGMNEFEEKYEEDFEKQYSNYYPIIYHQPQHTRAIRCNSIISTSVCGWWKQKVKYGLEQYNFLWLNMSEVAKIAKVPKATTKLSRKRVKDSVVEVEEESPEAIPDDINLRDIVDSSDEETLVRVGGIPLDWYEDYNHLGYSVEGKKVTKENEEEGSKLDEFMKRKEDKNWWRYITDTLNNRKIRLSDEEIAMIQRIRKGKLADTESLDPNRYMVEFDDPDFKFPMNNAPPPKSRFVPSKWERQKVMKIVHAMRMGWIKPQSEADRLAEEAQKIWDIWEDDSVPMREKQLPKHIPAQKGDLPLHSESYNPPPEYLFDENELKEWEQADESERRLNYVPQQYSALRRIQPYDRLVNDAFERCIELYLCPRLIRKKVRVDPGALVPKLPDPKELKPFPSFEALRYTGHKAKLAAISVDPQGTYLASGDASGVVIIWNVYTSRIIREYKFEEPIKDVQWNKNKDIQLIAITTENDDIVLVNPGLVPLDQSKATDALLANYGKAHSAELLKKGEEIDQDNEEEEKKGKKKKSQPKVVWEYYADTDSEYTLKHKRVHIKLEVVPQKLVWHGKGDYFATVASHTQTAKQVLVHSLSKSRSQALFAKSKGIVECVEFHPEKPFFFVATRKSVYLYNLQKQVLIKKFLSGSQWISSISIHPKGDNFIVGTYDQKVIWFDIDMGEKPYKTLKYSDKAVRKVDFHSKYPLFASASDDGSVYVFHGMVYDDLFQNALIVPLKLLQGHKVSKDLGVLSCVFHPKQPWVFSSGADCEIKLWSQWGCIHYYFA